MLRRNFLKGLAALPTVPVLLRIPDAQALVQTPIAPEALPFISNPIPQPIPATVKGLLQVFAENLAHDRQVAIEALTFELIDETSRQFMLHAIDHACNEFYAHRLIHSYQVVCDATNNPPAVVDRRDIQTDVFVKVGLRLDVYHFRLDNDGIRTIL